MKDFDIRNTCKEIQKFDENAKFHPTRKGVSLPAPFTSVSNFTLDNAVENY